MPDVINCNHCIFLLRKQALKKRVNNSILLMTCHHQDLGTASDWLRVVQYCNGPHIKPWYDPYVVYGLQNSHTVGLWLIE